MKEMGQISLSIVVWQGYASIFGGHFEDGNRVMGWCTESTIALTASHMNMTQRLLRCAIDFARGFDQ